MPGGDIFRELSFDATKNYTGRYVLFAGGVVYCHHGGVSGTLYRMDPDVTKIKEVYKMRRAKWFSLFLALVMCMAVLAVSASASNDEGGIAPHYDLCPDCGGESRLLRSVWDGIEVQTGERDCPDYPFGTDIQRTEYGTVYWKCNLCGYSFQVPTSRSRWECHGYKFDRSGSAEEVSCTHDYPFGTDLLLADGKKECHGFAFK